MYVIGTAGHVDHGKSTLVRALTGIDPDRLREEKLREMTIDLGFAWLRLPNGESVGFIDVPGHRDFINNMLAGVGGIDAVLLIIAADEGVMPQTREHLAILDLLSVTHGVVALTKTDLADSEEWIELVTADVSETLEGTTLEGAPIVPVSARDGTGLDDVVSALTEMLSRVEPRLDRGRPRLPIDRVFTISGFGVVVTGTLTDGYFGVGQEVEIQPSGRRARVRGLQTHQEKIERAAPGNRVAMNLSGISKDNLVRGEVVTIPGQLHPTMLADVRLRYLPDAGRALRHNTQLMFFSGASETVGRVRLLDRDKLSPGDTGWVQFRLQDPQPLVMGDRFIVRVPSPPMTVGGGVVVDPHPGRKHHRLHPEVIKRLETLAQGSPADMLLQDLERRGPTTTRELLAGGLGDAAQVVIEELVRDRNAVTLDAGFEQRAQGVPIADTLRPNTLLASHTWWSTTRGLLEQMLSSYHRQYPLQLGMSREAIRSGLGLQPKVFDALMDRARAESLILGEGALVRFPSHEVHLSPEQQQKVDVLLRQFRHQPYAPPSVKDCAQTVGEDVLGALLQRADLLQVSSDVVFLPETYEDVKARVSDYLVQNGSITLAQVRDIFGTSRKYAQALIEYLDSQGVTKRVGDSRVLRQA